MAETRKGSLKSLDGIYRFPGGLRAPGEVDIEAPIGIVHDVSRDAGALSGVYFTHDQTIVTDGGGTIDRNAIDRASVYTLPAFVDAIRNSGLNPGNSDLWLVRVELQTDNPSNVNNLACGFQDWPNPGPRFRVLTFTTTPWIGVGGVGVPLTVSDDPAMKFASTSTAPRQTVRLPVRVGSLATIAQDDNTAVVVTATVLWRLAIMPLGVSPLPGA